MSHETIIMNGGESPLASKLKSRPAAPAYEQQSGATQSGTDLIRSGRRSRTPSTASLKQPQQPHLQTPVD